VNYYGIVDTENHNRGKIFVYSFIIYNMIKFYTKSFDQMNKYKLGLSMFLISIFIGYFYMLTQSWTELPFSTCTRIASEYGDVLVPLGTEGMTFVYSPDNGFNTCRTNMLTMITPIVSLFLGIIIFGIELFTGIDEE